MPHDGNDAWVARPLADLPRASTAFRAAYRARLARIEMPWALRWAALAAMVVATVDALLRPAGDGFWLGAYAVAAAVLGLGSLALPRLPDGWLGWSFAALMTASIAPVLVANVVAPSWERLAVAFVLTVAVAPLVQAWAPYGCMVLVLGAVDVVAGTRMHGGPTATGLSVLPLVTALLFGGVLLSARLRSFNRQADLAALAEHLATTDPLTGVLNRQGLGGALPGLQSMARRLVQPVVVWVFEVDGLREANARHGDAFGDDLLRAAARAIKHSVRADDVVARVGSNEFLVAGIGTMPDQRDLPGRVRTAFGTTGPGGEGWPSGLQCGSASGLLTITDLPELMARAGADLRARQAPDR